MPVPITTENHEGVNRTAYHEWGQRGMEVDGGEWRLTHSSPEPTRFRCEERVRGVSDGWARGGFCRGGGGRGCDGG
jgi:hypothetical protein